MRVSGEFLSWKKPQTSLHCTKCQPGWLAFKEENVLQFRYDNSRRWAVCRQIDTGYEHWQHTMTTNSWFSQFHISRKVGKWHSLWYKKKLIECLLHTVPGTMKNDNHPEIVRSQYTNPTEWPKRRTANMKFRFKWRDGSYWTYSHVTNKWKLQTNDESIEFNVTTSSPSLSLFLFFCLSLVFPFSLSLISFRAHWIEVSPAHIQKTLSLSFSLSNSFSLHTSTLSHKHTLTHTHTQPNTHKHNQHTHTRTQKHK